MKIAIEKTIKIMKDIWKRDSMKILIFFSFFLIVLSWTYFSVDRFTSLDDHFFHIKFAQIFHENGLDAFREFHWLYFSKISIDQSYFIYYNFLFYLVLIPFTYITPLLLGIKLYAVIFCALSFTLLYYFLLKIKIKNAFLWVLLMFAVLNYFSIWRFLLTRPYALAPALLLILIYFLYKKNYWGIFIFNALYLYWHTATFFFPLGISVLYFLFEGFYQRKPDWKVVFLSVAGISAGLISLSFFAPGLINFMRDIVFRTFFETTIRGNETNINEGLELFPVNAIDFMKANAIILTGMIIAVVFEIYQYIESKKKELDFSQEFSGKQVVKGSLFFLSLLFLLGTFISRRNGDFFVFFSIAYIIMSFSYFFEHIKLTNDLLKKSLSLGIIIATIYLFAGNILFLNNQIASSEPHNAIQGSAEWLKNNTKKGDIVFNTSWNYFTTLFYYNSQNYYIAGIEPRFLYDYDPKFYWAWRNISDNGYLCFSQQCDNLTSARNNALRKEEQKNEWFKNQGNQIADAIKNMFKSQYIVTSTGTKYLNDIMDHNDRFERVYTDFTFNKYFVYKIVK